MILSVFFLFSIIIWYVCTFGPHPLKHNSKHASIFANDRISSWYTWPSLPCHLHMYPHLSKGREGSGGGRWLLINENMDSQTLWNRIWINIVDGIVIRNPFTLKMNTFNNFLFLAFNDLELWMVENKYELCSIFCCFIYWNA